MSDSNWFSQAGSLDDSLDSETTSVDSAPTSKDSVKSNNVSSTASTYIKPVKGLKEKTVASVRTGAETSNSNSTAKHVTPIKEETRCKNCGAVIPKGTTLCWKCSTSASVVGDKDGKREMHALVSPSEAFLGNNRKPIMIGAACVVLIIIIGIVVAISKSQKIDLKKLVCTDEILNYQLEDGTIIKSSVNSFEVISSSTKDKHDYSEVKVVLKDDFLERTLYISTESTKYDQGWSIDSMTVTDSSFSLIGEVDQNYIIAYLSQDRPDDYGQGNISNYRTLNGIAIGFKNLTKTSSTIQDNSYFAVYDVNESYQYANITGSLYVRVDLSMNSNIETGSCYITRSISIDTESLSTEWHDIYGTYLMSIPYSMMNTQQYITIDADKNVYGYCDYIGATSGQPYHEELTGTFNQVGYSTAIVQVGNTGDYCEYIIFTPNEISYRYLRPNGSNYDTGSGYDTVIFERIN